MFRSSHPCRVALFFVAISMPSAATESPFGLTAHRVSPFQADLYWFFPGVNDSILLYDDGVSDVPVAVCERDRRNRVAVRFDQFSPPACVRGGLVHILNYDNDPSLPGTPLSPIEVSLHLDESGRPGDLVSGPVTVAASGNWILGGEWVYAELEYVHDHGDPIWLQVRWPSTNPFMPKLGADVSAPDGVSVFGYMAGGVDVWDDFDGHDIMLRLEILLNTEDVQGDSADDDVDSFRVYGSDRMSFLPGDCSYIATTSSAVLHHRVPTCAGDNFFCVTAFADDVENEPSNILRVAVATGDKAPATVFPRDMEISVPHGEDVIACMEISNLGDDRLWYAYNEDCLATAGESGIPMTIIRVSDSLDVGQTGSVEFVIGSSQLEVGDYNEKGMIDFWDALQIYLPESVSIHLTVIDRTAADAFGEQSLPLPVLRQNYPNPFNSQTRITVDNADCCSDIALRIVDILGCTVVRLSPGHISGRSAIFRWDGRDAGGSSCPSGIYFYSICDGRGGWRKMLLIR